MTTEKIVRKLNKGIKRDLLRKLGCRNKQGFLALLKPTVSGWLVVFLLFQLIAGALLPFQISPTRPFVKLQETQAAGEGWLSGWAYRKPISVQNSTSTLTDYQTKIQLNPSNFDYSKASSTLADIRLTDSSGTTTLSYWIENASTTATSTIWVKVPTLTGSATTTIYIYYGNPSAASASNGADVFEFFDDFSGDLSKWNVMAGTWAIFNGKLILSALSGRGGLYATEKNFSDAVIEF
ncbi:DUF2341 domain-containing protein, partial [Patescibacteria group bacterium]|nr:DUF2341 domain-containing protein [Patescibacteria group bacterium]